MALKLLPQHGVGNVACRSYTVHQGLVAHPPAGLASRTVWRRRLCESRFGDYRVKMLRRTPRFRYFALAFVALQLVLRAVVGVADARLNAVSGPWEHYVHYESKGSNHIPPEHGTDCGLCSYLSASFTRAPAVGIELLSVRLVVPVELRVPRPARAASAVLPPARAPPSV